MGHKVFHGVAKPLWNADGDDWILVHIPSVLKYNECDSVRCKPVGCAKGPSGQRCATPHCRARLGLGREYASESNGQCSRRHP